MMPTFRDRFTALVNVRLNLSAIDKMYYLIGYLRGMAADVVRDIPVSVDSYALTTGADSVGGRRASPPP